MIKNHANKILVVEDEVVIAMRLKQMLTKMGYNVIGVSYSGEDALEKVRSLRPEIILMDIILSGKLDGAAQRKQRHLFISGACDTLFSQGQQGLR